MKLIAPSRKYPFLYALLLLGATIILVSCGYGEQGRDDNIYALACRELATGDPPPETIGNDENDRLAINNDSSELEQITSCMDVAVPVSGIGATMAASESVVGAKAVGARRGRWRRGFSLRLVAQTSPPTIVGKAVPLSYSLLISVRNDLTAGGMYQRGGEISRRYRVEIDDTTGIVDTFRWSIDDETTWVATGVPITGISHSLNSGVTVTFGATTGHIVGDAWQIDAGMLQATSVAIKGSSTIVSYSMIGAPFLGALRVYRTFFGFPFLRSQALFRDMDVNAVTVSGNKVYAVGAREPAVPPHAATLEVLQLSGSRLLLGGGGQATLTSYAATSVMHDPDWSTIYTTSGNGGGLTALDDTTLLQSSFDPLSDARWVDSELDTLVVVRGGNADGVNGSIDVFSTAVGGVPTFVNSFGFTGADIVESKSTAEIVGGKAFISAGSGGAQVLSTFTGVLLDSVPNPTVTGLLPAEVVANAVTIDNDLMFISNGEAGVYVAQADEDFDRSGPDGPVSLTLLGKLQFGVDQSVNHVAFKNNYLYIASGLGGLKIVRVTSP